MGVRIKVARAPESNRRCGSDKVVRKVAPYIRTLQAAKDATTTQIADALNAAEIYAPSGGPWAYSTMRRAIHRAAELNLGVIPRKLSSPRTRGTGTPKWIGIISTDQIRGE